LHTPEILIGLKIIPARYASSAGNETNSTSAAAYVMTGTLVGIARHCRANI
jgi:hypothetical protein